MTIDEFYNKYYEFNSEKYGDNWMDVVIEQLLKEGITIEFVD